MMQITNDQIRKAIEQMNRENRHGVEYSWPADSHFGKLERAIDGFAFRLDQLPPLTWCKSLADWLACKLNR